MDKADCLIPLHTCMCGIKALCEQERTFMEKSFPDALPIPTIWETISLGGL